MIVIAAGGTGGHMLPGLAIARAVDRARPGQQICFVGAGRGIESTLTGGHPVFATSVRTFGPGLRGRLAPLSVLPAVSQARAILKRVGAKVVVGMGGYPSLPVVLAARTRGIPSVLHEQNAVPGLANSFCSRFTPHVAISFPVAAAAFGERIEPRSTGLPIRDEIAALGDRARHAQMRAEAVPHFGLDPDRPTILVSGGSLGARRLNASVIEMTRAWEGAGPAQVLLACGQRDAADVLAASAGIEGLHVRPFIERMDLAYAVADLALTRGGASTVAELAAAGLPAVIVPLPIARRREQDANAAVLVSAGAAEVLADDGVTPSALDSAFRRLLSDRANLEAMAASARAQARPEAAAEVASFVLEVMDAA